MKESRIFLILLLLSSFTGWQLSKRWGQASTVGAYFWRFVLRRVWSKPAAALPRLAPSRRHRRGSRPHCLCREHFGSSLGEFVTFKKIDFFLSKFMLLYTVCNQYISTALGILSSKSVEGKKWSYFRFFCRAPATGLLPVKRSVRGCPPTPARPTAPPLAAAGARLAPALAPAPAPSTARIRRRTVPCPAVTWLTFIRASGLTSLQNARKGPKVKCRSGAEFFSSPPHKSPADSYFCHFVNQVVYKKWKRRNPFAECKNGRHLEEGEP